MSAGLNSGSVLLNFFQGKQVKLALSVKKLNFYNKNSYLSHRNKCMIRNNPGITNFCLPKSNVRTILTYLVQYGFIPQT